MRVRTKPGQSTDTRTAEPEHGELVVERLTQADDGELRGAVGAEAGDAAEAGE